MLSLDVIRRAGPRWVPEGQRPVRARWESAQDRIRATARGVFRKGTCRPPLIAPQKGDDLQPSAVRLLTEEAI